ncbi:hypothetical protein TNCV_4027491 [Trichonephila clavipes]|nr:hypothetical protein TNCV_4027491 [Trichonephila clavipes]
MDRHIELHVIDRGTLTVHKDGYQTLEIYGRLFRGAYGPNFIFMDDNTRKLSLSWWTNTSNRRIFNQWNDLLCSLTLIPSNTHGTSFDSQLYLKDQL